MYFSFFDRSLYNTEGELYEMERLAMYIRNHPHASRIADLRKLPKSSTAYKLKKRKFPYITGCSICEEGRGLDYVTSLSGYIYLDIDVKELVMSVDDTLKYLQAAHANDITLCGKSISGKGVFIFVRVQNNEQLTVDTFDAVQQYIKKNIFRGLSFDDKADGYAQAHILSHDPDVFYNPDAHVVIPDEAFTVTDKTTRKKGTSRGLSLLIGYDNIRPIPSYTSLDEIKRLFKFSTIVDVGDEQCIEKEIAEFVDVKVLDNIKDGYKHIEFTQIINKLVFLNPDISFDEIYKIIYFINENHTGGDKMLLVELYRYSYAIYHESHQQKALFKGYWKKTKRFHVNAILRGKSKRQALNKCIGRSRKQASFDRIKTAVDTLDAAGLKLTAKNVYSILQDDAELKLGICTIKKYLKQVIAGVMPDDLEVVDYQEESFKRALEQKRDKEKVMQVFHFQKSA